MAWRRAESLVVLETEIQAVAPGTTVWDIGDEAHQRTWSDHNPNAAGVVCAIDVLDDAGLDLGWFAESVRTSGHPAGKYAIYDRRIASRSRGWSWRPYHGSNPHTGHVHVSVGRGPDGRSTGPYDDTSPWGIEEDTMDLRDRVDMTDGEGGRWSFGHILGKDDMSVNAAFGYAAAGGWQIQREVVPMLAVIRAAVTAGSDLTEEQVEAAVRRGMDPDAIADAVAARVTVDRDAVAGALREVLGGLDEEPA